RTLPHTSAPSLFTYTTLFRSQCTCPHQKPFYPPLYAGLRYCKPWCSRHPHSDGRRPVLMPDYLQNEHSHALCHHAPDRRPPRRRSEEHTSELQSRENLVCRLL